MTLIPTDLRSWNKQQALLRRLLFQAQDYRQALPIFLIQHQAVHTARLVPGARWSLQDQVLTGLTEAQMRAVPQGRPHSVAWALWHISRIEDATLNLLLADSRQVFSTDGWPRKLGTEFAGVGNALSGAETVELSCRLNLRALLSYRLAVGRRTRALVHRLDPEILWSPPSPRRLSRLTAEGVVSESETWLLEYWGGHPAANLLLMPATRHPFVHLNEISRLLPRLKRL